MAERLEEVNRLYRTMSHEGWETYRSSQSLPKGFVFDQAGIKPVEEANLSEELFAGVQMMVPGGETVGTLAVSDDPQNPVSVEDRTFLMQVSEQVALALESARLAAQTQSALAQSETLFQVSSRLTQAADLQELVKAVAETMNIPEVNRIDLDIFNYDSDGNLESMDVIANWWSGNGTSATPIGSHFSKEQMRVISSFLSPTPVFFNDTLTDERMDPGSVDIIVNTLKIRAGAVIPLYAGTRQIGLLAAESDTPREFKQEEIRLFTALAPQIATVMENRRQFERARQQAERESMLNLIGQKIQSATTVEDVLQIAARELGHALGAPMTIARLNIKDKK
jgi:GAF domain-containing protein